MVCKGEASRSERTSRRVQETARNAGGRRPEGLCAEVPQDAYERRRLNRLPVFPNAVRLSPERGKLELSKTQIRGGEFHRLIRQRMKAKGMTKYKLAATAGVPRSTVYRYLQGETDILGGTIFRLLSVLGLAVVEKEND